MKKIHFLFIFIFLVTKTTVFSQKKTNAQFYHPTLKEQIFVHQNATFFLAGEKLYYQVYCIKTRNNRLSKLSRLAYVELVDSEKNVLFKHTIRLEEGVGNGMFKIPAEVPSGNYKLLAYTQWMRNEGESQFFKTAVTIVNPTESNQNFSLSKTDGLQATSKKEVIIALKNAKKKSTASKNDFIELIVAEKTYKKREKVVLNITSSDFLKSEGKYSISIRKIDQLEKPFLHTSKTYVSLYPKKASDRKKGKIKAVFLPELKGEIFKGVILHKKTGKPVPNIKVVLSVPDKKFKYRFSITNHLGVFEFLFKDSHVDSKAIIQILDDQKENYKLSLFQQKPLNYSGLTFTPLEMSPEASQELTTYSVYSQIENAYSSVKRNVISKTAAEYIYRTVESYDLDDYTRFATVKETIVEIVKNVWITKRRKQHVFHVKNNDGWDEEKHLPLVVVDGVFIQDHNEIVEFNSRKIKTISVLRERYTYKSYVFQGVVFIETFEGAYKKDEETDFLKNVYFFVSSEEEEFYHQKYVDKKLARIPDYRRQLLWVPKFNLNNKQHRISFYTSDISGSFEISVEGFTKKGIPVSLKKIINVE